MPGNFEARSSSTDSDSSRRLDVENSLDEGSSRSESCLNADEVRVRAQGLRSSRGRDMLYVLCFIVLYS
jgi:hypothetical protein